MGVDEYTDLGKPDMLIPGRIAGYRTKQRTDDLGIKMTVQVPYLPKTASSGTQWSAKKSLRQ
jgi:hypothetical protein